MVTGVATQSIGHRIAKKCRGRWRGSKTDLEMFLFCPACKTPISHFVSRPDRNRHPSDTIVLVQLQKHAPNIKHSPGERSSQTQNVCITFVQRWNVGPTSSALVQHCTNVIQMFRVNWGSVLMKSHPEQDMWSHGLVTPSSLLLRTTHVVMTSRTNIITCLRNQVVLWAGGVAVSQHWPLCPRWDSFLWLLFLDTRVCSLISVNGTLFYDFRVRCIHENDIVTFEGMINTILGQGSVFVVGRIFSRKIIQGSHKIKK